jgi:hypothetical protein
MREVNQMAKKKTESAEKAEAKDTKAAKPAEKKAAAPKAGAAKVAAPKAKKAKPQAAPSSPMIDTGLAAETAAKMIMAGARPAQAPAENAQPKKESSTFKQLKESLAKPHINSGNPLLGNPVAAGNKNKPGFFGGKQVGHNQTFGSGSSRSVPRRTSG